MSFFTRVSLRRLVPLGAFAAATALAFGACDLSTSPLPSTARNYGLVTLSAVNAGGSPTRALAKGEFFHGSLASIPNSTAPYDSCRQVSLPLDTTLTGVSSLDAGSFLTIASAGHVDSLRPVTSGSRPIYLPGGNGTVALNPGDSVDIAIAGTTTGFPAVSVRARASESFTLGPVSVPASNEGIPLTWTAPTEPNSAMLVELRFATSASSTFDQEIRCFFVDNGADSVPARLAAFWANPTNTKRDVVATRFRTRIVPVSGGFLDVLSLFQVPTPAAP